MSLKIKTVTVILAAACAAGVIACSGCKKKDSAPVNNDEYNPASGLAMTSSQADSLENALSVRLYYKSAASNYITGETALIEFQSADRKLSRLAESVIAKLLEGPADVKGLVGVIPEGTEIKNISFKNGTVTMDVNQKFIDGIAEDADKAKLAVYSIVNTLTEFKDISKVEFCCDGKSIEPLKCGFVFKVFERDLSIVKSDSEASTSVSDPYAEELYEGVPLE